MVYLVDPVDEYGAQQHKEVDGRKRKPATEEELRAGMNRARKA